jgi:hypothetical protein
VVLDVNMLCALGSGGIIGKLDTSLVVRKYDHWFLCTIIGTSQVVDHTA